MGNWGRDGLDAENGAGGLGSMLGRERAIGALPGFPHLPVKAKRVIFLCMGGGPSHLETFDYKPMLDELNGKPMPESFTKGQPIAQLQGKALKVQGHLTKFKPYGQSGQLVSDFLPWTAKMADDIAIVRSMVTEQINHDPAHTFMNTGTAISGHPSMGSWINYGLGCETENLPGRDGQWRLVDAVQGLDRHRNAKVGNPEIDTRIAAYEMAFRMQASVPELADVSDEPQHILDMYGATPGDGSYASNCLLARRLAERGTRFIHLYHRGWDHHGGLEKYMNICCGLTDKLTWALLTDLKQRGMLDDTLVIWGGEFGRTPMFQGKGGAGRDHHIKGFSMWMAGGGVKGGVTHGATDELGYNAVENVVHVRDLHASMLHLLGIQHDRFSVQHHGLDARLTGVEEAKVVRDVLA